MKICSINIIFCLLSAGLVSADGRENQPVCLCAEAFGNVRTPTGPQPGDIVISEIYFEPISVSPLPNSEFVELFNRNDSAIQLAGCTITDGSSNVILPTIELQPGSYCVLYDKDDSLLFISIHNAIALPSLPALNNDVGDHLKLLGPDGALIDDVKFNNDTYRDDDKKNGGWTLERIDNNFLCRDAMNWKACSAPMHGTPGVVNSVAGTFSDRSHPFAIAVYPADSFTIKIAFSEPVHSGGNDPSNYFVSDNAGLQINVHSVDMSSNSDSATLNLSGMISKGICTINFSGELKDCAGNSIEQRAERFGFHEPAEAKDILINELLFDSQYDGTDFLELFNRSEKIINLQGWFVIETENSDTTDERESAVVTSGSRFLFPGEYMVLSREEKKVKEFYACPDSRFIDIVTMPEFNSDEGCVKITDNNGNTVDAFRYSEEMHFPLLSGTKGVSLERISLNVLEDLENNWHSAAATAGFATPGYANSQQVSETTGDGEVYAGKEIFSPDNDGYDDVFTIHYQFRQAGTVLSLNVYNYNGLLIRRLLSSQSVAMSGMTTWNGLSDDGTIAMSGIYFLLAKSFDINGKSKVYRKAFFLTGR